MTTKEASNLTIKHLGPFLESAGFKQIKSAPDIEFKKKHSANIDDFYCGFTNFYPIQIYVYSLGKRYEEIEAILKDLDHHFPAYFSPKRLKDRTTFRFSYESIVDYREHGTRVASSLPDMTSEDQLIANVVKIKQFLSDCAFPLLEKFEAIENLDEEINSEKYWHTDELMKYSFGIDFFLIRTIIAHKCNNPNYSTITKFHLLEIENGIKDSNYPESYKEMKEIYCFLLDFLMTTSFNQKNN